MKKGSLITLIVTIVISLFLLWLWYFLGFNYIDNPFDLVLSIIWWLVMVTIVVGMWRIEKVRQQRMRSIYVGKSILFNPQVGEVAYEGQQQIVSKMQYVLDEIKYDFNKEEMPDPDECPFALIVRTDKYKVNRDQDENGEEKTEWEGSVCYHGEEGEEEGIAFESREELSQLINKLSPRLAKI